MAVHRGRAAPCLNCGKFGNVSDDGRRCVCEAGAFGPSCRKPEWSPWSKWSACSAPCGDGTKTRRRLCDAPKGTNCPRGRDTENLKCNLGACATEWSEWSACAASCFRTAPGAQASGRQTRARKCVHKICRKLATEQSRTCRKTCPIHCPTANKFYDCSGHGNCVLAPKEGCTQQATCRWV